MSDYNPSSSRMPEAQQESTHNVTPGTTTDNTTDENDTTNMRLSEVKTSKPTIVNHSSPPASVIVQQASIEMSDTITQELPQSILSKAPIYHSPTAAAARSIARLDGNPHTITGQTSRAIPNERTPLRSSSRSTSAGPSNNQSYVDRIAYDQFRPLRFLLRQLEFTEYQETFICEVLQGLTPEDLVRVREMCDTPTADLDIEPFGNVLERQTKKEIDIKLLTNILMLLILPPRFKPCKNTGPSYSNATSSLITDEEELTALPDWYTGPRESADPDESEDENQERNAPPSVSNGSTRPKTNIAQKLKYKTKMAFQGAKKAFKKGLIAIGCAKKRNH